MHRQAIPFIARCVERDFPTLLITNASALNPRRVEELIATGLDEISVSFWGIERDEYQAAMHLPYDRTLANVEELAKGARRAGVPLAISWVRVPEVSSTNEQIQNFWSSRGIEVNMSDNAMWNRAGLLSVPQSLVDVDVLRPPDESRHVWCADLKYTDAWTWDGRLVLCCCSFFMERQYQVGDITSDWREISDAKLQILSARPIPSMCRSCLLPRRNQAEWLTRPWRDVLSDAEWRDITYQD